MACILQFMVGQDSGFGAHLRKLRVKQGLGLRQLAKTIGVSPTYLSLVEQGKLAPPAERQVVALAKKLGQEEDVFLAMAGRIASDLPGIVKKHPRLYAHLLRAFRNLREKDLHALVDTLEALESGAVAVEFKHWRGTSEEAERQVAEYRDMLSRIDYKALARSKGILEAKIGDRKIDILFPGDAIDCGENLSLSASRSAARGAKRRTRKAR